ncbi:rRNA maturation RNase YbeY [Enterobacteriaceae endosymbiont of Donacia semicuprea]|uniref:rRNA maturation RNase YbeY n=1 Tax=Enterobacteriaceae endosymbiont of Donacia semicuprea TaxID=2675783 RepID=UPI00144A24A1|nr:rRNA maturation RNase YbeY [Enterobacteriaceae endosymbiont of Donacia semicuprea]QJC32957.1 rRNA maturation RNase YbeY [Enterobacteriaceae endosymbiont of Donacia semicuprea]
MKSKILLNYYNYCKNNYNLPTKNEIFYWLNIIFKKKNIKNVKNIEITISIVTKNIIEKLNKKYLKISKPTNVLSFLLENNFLKKKLLGDIILCKEIIEYESILQKKALKFHYTHIIIHSVLHLLQYEHKNFQEANLMELEEINILKLLGYKNPYL